MFHDCGANARRGLLQLLAVMLLLTGCEGAMRDMYEQPNYRPLEPSPLFPDNRSARPLPPGTLPSRGGAMADSSSGTFGWMPEGPSRQVVYPLGPDGRPLAGPPDAGFANPLPISRALLARGRERFEIYCVPCHSPLGDGDGMVVRRGFPAPPSFHTDRLRRAPDSHLFAVISRGYGAMYPYGSRVEPADRWAIVAYIRALQLSQNLPVARLSPAERGRFGTGMERGGRSHSGRPEG